MNAKIFVFVICVEIIIYLLLYNLHDCTIYNTLPPFLEFSSRFRSLSNFQSLAKKFLGLFKTLISTVALFCF